MTESETATWHKVAAKDRMMPWGWQIKRYVGTLEEACVADHLTEADADAIIADRNQARRVPMLEHKVTSLRDALTSRHGACWDCGNYTGKDLVQGGRGDSQHDSECRIGKMLALIDAEVGT